MFIRATKEKFSTKLKCAMYLAYVKTEALQKLAKNSKISSLKTLIIGEEKTLGIATYNN